MGSVLINHIGEVHGRLTVVERDEDYVSLKGKHHVRYRCQCRCGNEVVVTWNQLRDGKVRSCGCLRRETNTARVLKDLTDQLFGDWVVLGRAPKNYRTPDGTQSKVLWIVECICGTVSTATSGNLRQGQTTSCGHPSLPGYYTMHYRIVEVRGPAYEYSCVDCGALGMEWSYNNAADVEIIEPGLHRGKPVTRRYSLNLFDYAPRCGKCHRRFDRR